MPRGALIAIEGIDGAGKTVNSRWVVDLIGSMGLRSSYTREPTDGPIGRLLRSGAFGEFSDPRVDALLFAADRLHHLAQTIEPLLSEGVMVVSDRYVHSSIAYQGALTGDRAWVEELNRFARRPDLAIYLDVDPAIGLSRKLSERPTKFERVEVLERVRDLYLELCEEGELLRIDASRDLENVRKDLMKAVEELLRNLR
ncbi:MAG: dTMP kinase [Thaumarchaeota archaeon]|nr:dTMP kinase [Candidatus Calditenuaceae archaeon]MDW8187593.1 dTMP kinase [Nitrososphaerota archaeon]